MVSAGLAIYDTMQYIRSPVSTVCIGLAASMGSLLLAAGAKGKRYALPNARIMVHQPSGGAQGQATDIEIQAREILTLRKRLNEIYVRHTGQPIEAIERQAGARQLHVGRGGAGLRPGRRGGGEPPGAGRRGRRQGRLTLADRPPGLSTRPPAAERMPSWQTAPLRMRRLAGFGRVPVWRGAPGCDPCPGRSGGVRLIALRPR